MLQQRLLQRFEESPCQRQSLVDRNAARGVSSERVIYMPKWKCIDFPHVSDGSNVGDGNRSWGTVLVLAGGLL